MISLAGMVQLPVAAVGPTALYRTEAARQWIAKTGYDPDFGARPLKRVLQREVADPIALDLLKGDFREGETIVVDAKPDGGLVFDIAATGEVVD